MFKNWTWKQWTALGVIAAVVIAAVVCHLVQPTVSYAWLEVVAVATFALGVIFAIIVIHDAVGVRLETGKQAKVLNEMIIQWRDMGKDLMTIDPMDTLKEFVGHTPLQVLVGAILGIVVAVLVHQAF